MTHSALPIEEYLRARSIRLLRTAYLLTGVRQDAEDLVQTTMAKLWPRWDRVVAAGDPDAYVKASLINAYLSIRRRRRAVEVLVPVWGERAARDGAASSAGFDAATKTADELETRVVVLRALSRLPARQRATVVLRYYEDLAERQVAEIMNCGVGTVKSQTAKALSALRRDLADLALRGDHA